MSRQRWPAQLWLVRHGQSQGNVARDAAQEARGHVIELDWRDVDVPLSDLGHRQADAVGRWFADLPEDERPEVLLASPYIRARQTAEAICTAGGLAGGAKPTILDERLREREFGVFDGLTTLGIRERYPEEAAHRAKMGKFYHRPPGGESWADVILRLRSVLNSVIIQYEDRRVLIVCHQVVVLCMRYILEELTEAQILDIDRQAEILNCGSKDGGFRQTLIARDLPCGPPERTIPIPKSPWKVCPPFTIPDVGMDSRRGGGPEAA